VTERRLLRDFGFWLSGAATVIWAPAAWRYFIAFLAEASQTNDLAFAILQKL